MDALKKKFREGQHAQAIAEAEALLLEDPGNAELKNLCAMMNAMTGRHVRALELLRELRDAKGEDADLLFNIAICEREMGDFEAARKSFATYTGLFPGHSHGWAGLGECQHALGASAEGLQSADRAIKLQPSSVAAWTVRGNCQKALGRLDDALASYRKAIEIQPTVECLLGASEITRRNGRLAEAFEYIAKAIALAPDLASLRVTRGDMFHAIERLEDAVADYREALRLKPEDDETLRKASLCLLETHQGVRALELCRSLVEAQHGGPAARQSTEWVLSQLVPSWHVPMINEQERNGAYHAALASTVAPDRTVFEIGTGSGLLAMMAAKLGARHVYACEAVDLIADAASRVVRRNGLQDRITILAKTSQEVSVGSDLPAKADILVHEIFSSDLLSEDVLPAVEDAKERLLKAQGQVVPPAACIMIALVGGDDLASNLYVKDSFGFDLSDFNAITPRRRVFREDLDATLMSEPVAAFRFDFQNESTFPAERKVLKVGATADGICLGIVQWIRIELNGGSVFENHPTEARPVANWQRTIHALLEPIPLRKGSVVSINASHDRKRPWFELAQPESDPA